MILTIKQAHEQVSTLLHDTFSKDSESQAKMYISYLSDKGLENSFIKKHQKNIPLIADRLYKINDMEEVKAYTDSLSVEAKSALIERFSLFLKELQNFRTKKIEIPYSRNLMLKLILIEFESGSTAITVKHRH